MRTSVRLDDQLFAQARRLAAQTGRTLSAVMEDALRAALARPKQARRRTRVRLTTFGGRGLQPGVDLDDTAALLDRMERSDAAG